MAQVSKSNKTQSNKTLEQKLAVVAELATLADFRKAKQAEAKAKKAKALAEAKLREALGNSLEGLVEGAVVVKVVAGRNTHFDREVLEEMFPEAYQATIRETLYDYLKTL